MDSRSQGPAGEKPPGRRAYGAEHAAAVAQGASYPNGGWSGYAGPVGRRGLGAPGALAVGALLPTAAGATGPGAALDPSGGTEWLTGPATAAGWGGPA